MRVDVNDVVDSCRFCALGWSRHGHAESESFSSASSNEAGDKPEVARGRGPAPCPAKRFSKVTVCRERGREGGGVGGAAQLTVLSLDGLDEMNP